MMFKSANFRHPLDISSQDAIEAEAIFSVSFGVFPTRTRGHYAAIEVRITNSDRGNRRFANSLRDSVEATRRHSVPTELARNYSTIKQGNFKRPSSTGDTGYQVNRAFPLSFDDALRNS